MVSSKRPASESICSEAPGKARSMRGIESFDVADLLDRLHRRREVAAVVSENRCSGADLTGPRGCAGVGAQMVVEPPRSQLLADDEELGSSAWIGDLGQHAVEGAQALGDDRPLPVRTTEPDDAVVPVGELRRWPRHRSTPHPFPFDLRIQPEHGGGRRHRVPEIDGVPEVVAGETQSQRPRTGRQGPGRQPAAGLPLACPLLPVRPRWSTAGRPLRRAQRRHRPWRIRPAVATTGRGWTFRCRWRR